MRGQVPDGTWQGRRRMKQNKNQLINQAKEDFIMIIRQDPFLPFELLPEGWQGEVARTLVQKFI